MRSGTTAWWDLRHAGRARQRRDADVAASRVGAAMAARRHRTRARDIAKSRGRWKASSATSRARFSRASDRPPASARARLGFWPPAVRRAAWRAGSVDLQEIGGGSVPGKAAGSDELRRPRCVMPAAHGFRVSHTRAARAIRRRLVAPIAIVTGPESARALTSTKAITPPRCATRSISPPETAKRWARIV